MRGASLAVVLVAGCGGPQTPAVGFSAPRAVEARPDADGGAGQGSSPIPAGFRSTFTKVGDRFLSEGHGRRYQAVLWLNDVASAAWGALPAPMPDGSQLVEEATDVDRGGERPAGLWVMEKQGGAWRFVVVGTDGEVVSDARVAPCVQCHGAAPHDDVFVEVTPPAPTPAAR